MNWRGSTFFELKPLIVFVFVSIERLLCEVPQDQTATLAVLGPFAAPKSLPLLKVHTVDQKMQA